MAATRRPPQRHAVGRCARGLHFHPDDPKLPAATILDPECDDVKALEAHYRIVLQSLRMIDCKGVNRWQKSPRRASSPPYSEALYRNLPHLSTRRLKPPCTICPERLAHRIGLPVKKETKSCLQLMLQRALSAGYNKFQHS